MFEDFKNKFNKQNKQKKDELKKLFSSSKIKEDNSGKIDFNEFCKILRPQNEEEKKESNSKEINSNLENSEEPKISQEQMSLAEPSTEVGSKPK